MFFNVKEPTENPVKIAVQLDKKIIEISAIINLNAPDLRFIMAEKTKLKIIKGKTNSKTVFMDKLREYRNDLISVEIYSPRKSGIIKTEHRMKGRPIFFKNVLDKS